MADARLISLPSHKTERYTEHEWETWPENALVTSHMQLLLLRYVEVEHLFIHIPVWRNVVYTCLDRLLQNARKGASNRATKSRIGCATCGDITYVASPRPRDYLKMRCTHCSDFDSNVTPASSTLYMQFGGLLNAD